MKVFALLAVAATLSTEAVAQPHHNHQHHHMRRHAHAGSKVEKRDAKTVVSWVAGAIETVYELEGETISEEEATKGLANGRYVITGEDTPELPEPEVEEGNEEDEASQGAQFYEQEPSSTTAEPEPTQKAEQEKTNNSNAGGQGLDAAFPSGEIDCSSFPSDYGPIVVDYLGLGGWTGVQITPNYSPGSTIAYIETATPDGGCVAKSFCSYACPVGYQKTQWPDDQGATGQSIGGLYCNENGKLELTRATKSTLCEPGAGGVTIQNDLDSQVSTCRTDYPGTESMTIPTIAQGGQSGIPLTNPYTPDYYFWDGKPTTAQYYVNKKGRAADKACLWDSDEDHDGSGDWAPVNIGVGKNEQGLTFISLFANQPTSQAQLDFNIEIVGDVNAECALVGGSYTGGGNGCTTAIQDGQNAIIRFYQ